MIFISEYKRNKHSLITFLCFELNCTANNVEEILQLQNMYIVQQQIAKLVCCWCHDKVRPQLKVGGEGQGVEASCKL